MTQTFTSIEIMQHLLTEAINDNVFIPVGENEDGVVLYERSEETLT